MIGSPAKLTRRGGDPSRLFKAIADPSRRRILQLLATEDLPLKRIEQQFKMSRPAVIKHLRVLKSCHLVKVRRQGRETFHRLNSPPLREVRDWVSHFEMLWDESLTRLKRQIEGDL